MFPRPIRSTLILSILVVNLICGCDGRVAQIATEAANRQAQQNTVMADLNKEVATGAQQLVTADAEARQDILTVHHELQSERTRLDSGWTKLDSERREIAGQRRAESMLWPIATFVVGPLLLIVLLGFCWYVLMASRDSDDLDVHLNEILIQEILPPEPQPLFGNERRSSLLGHLPPK
jgi:hypothetical protein